MDYSRQSEFFDPSVAKYYPITIIGAGAVGSKIFENLVCMGFRTISVWDFDEVEEHNLPNQLYCPTDVGEYKVDGLKSWFDDKTEETLRNEASGMSYNQGKVEGDMSHHMRGIVFLAIDTMEDREHIFKASLQMNVRVDMVVECRIAAAHGNVYTFNAMAPKQYRQWLDTLIKDEDAEASLCGSSISIASTVNFCSAMAVNQVVSYINNSCFPDGKINFFLNPLIVNATDWD